MSKMNRNGFDEFTLNALRIVSGFLFMQHGVQKLFGWLDGNQVEVLMSRLGIAGIFETVGGVLMMSGLHTRPVALLLSGEMAVAYFTTHFPRGFWPIMNGGELAALYAFTWLFFFVNGPGGFSLDGLLESRRGRAPVEEP